MTTGPEAPVIAVAAALTNAEACGEYSSVGNGIVSLVVDPGPSNPKLGEFPSFEPASAVSHDPSSASREVKKSERSSPGLRER